ncbi:hypothetical protein B0T25DRAFT_584208 [Lasiosphaeria hispida]|uniref:Uncharacterized protein n=1 Tax=Lasiosphaeria hispida TaxID=260671 RepID=A0AAJ0HCU9_9PEZI|nr:hypothetical protein B0T25DRAFT_584208 [Lasiosphaeria hispida]
MVVDDMPAKAIAEEVGIGIHQARRYRARYKLTGSPFAEARTPQNSVVLAPWAMEKVFDLLKDKPDPYLDEIQWLLTLECNIYTSIQTISRHIRSPQWSKKKLTHKAARRMGTDEQTDGMRWLGMRE